MGYPQLLCTSSALVPHPIPVHSPYPSGFLPYTGSRQGSVTGAFGLSVLGSTVFVE